MLIEIRSIICEKRWWWWWLRYANYKEHCFNVARKSRAQFIPSQNYFCFIYHENNSTEHCAPPVSALPQLESDKLRFDVSFRQFDYSLLLVLLFILPVLVLLLVLLLRVFGCFVCLFVHLLGFCFSFSSHSLVCNFLLLNFTLQAHHMTLMIIYYSIDNEVVMS